MNNAYRGLSIRQSPRHPHPLPELRGQTVRAIFKRPRPALETLAVDRAGPSLLRTHLSALFRDRGVGVSPEAQDSDTQADLTGPTRGGPPLIEIGAIYRHYKGGLYRVLRVRDGCVEYEYLEPRPGAFRRTIDEFVGSVRRGNSVWVRRFERYPDKD